MIWWIGNRWVKFFVGVCRRIIEWGGGGVIVMVVVLSWVYVILGIGGKVK